MTTANTGYYIFGLRHNDQPLPVLSGFSEAQVEVVTTLANIEAVGCVVPLEEFGQDVITSLMEDMNWLGPVATKHYEICDQIYRQSGGFLPFRLCTIFSGTDTVFEMLKEEQVGIEQEFERLSGKAEFGLKVWGRDDWLTQTALAQDPKLREVQAQLEQGGGKAFFARKKFETDLAERKKRLLPQVGRRLATMVSAALNLTSDSIKTLALPPNQSGYVALANLTLLLDCTRNEALNALAEKIDTEILKGGLIEVPGPLPPYSFISLGREEGDGSA